MYKPEYCKELVTFGREGKSLKEFSEYAEIHVTTLYLWAEKYPEFKSSLNEYRDLKKKFFQELRNNSNKGLSKKGTSITSLSLTCTKSNEWDYTEGSNIEYKPEYCRLVVKLAIQGYTFWEICSKLGINQPIFRKWLTEHSEFRNAAETAKTKMQSYLIQLGKRSMKGKFNFPLWQFMMLNEFGLKEIKETEDKKAEEEEVQYVVVMPEMKDGQTD